MQDNTSAPCISLHFIVSHCVAFWCECTLTFLLLCSTATCNWMTNFAKSKVLHNTMLSWWTDANTGQNGGIWYTHGRKPGTHYLDLKLGYDFWNRIWIPVSGYKSLKPSTHIYLSVLALWYQLTHRHKTRSNNNKVFRNMTKIKKT